MAKEVKEKVKEEVEPETTHMNQAIKISAISLAIVFVLLAGVAAMGAMYDGRTVPSLKVGEVDVGGKTAVELNTEMEKLAKSLAEKGIAVRLDRGQGEELVQIPVDQVFNSSEATNEIFNFGKQGNILVRGAKVLGGMTGQVKLKLPGIVFSPEQAEELVKNNVAQFEQPAQNANFKISSVTPFKYTITTSSPGVVFDYTDLGKKIIKSWQEGEAPTVQLVSTVDQPEVSEADVQSLASSTAPVFSSPIVLTYYDSHNKRSHQWSIAKQQLADWSEVKRNENGVYLAIKTEAVSDFVSGTIKKVVDKPAKDAVFTLNASKTKATKFIGGQPGVTVDLAATEKGIEEVFVNRREGKTSTSTPLVIATVDPNIKTEDSNDLGIKEVLGHGWSSFAGSPRNRILNLKHAVNDKLHGTIIKPGEEFSLVQTLMPFTLEDGYLSELVILGNRITPAIGGGLCQVGTTMFRAVMNSGLLVTARTNHGLWIPYYNDPSNGNPGTDATIFEPNPDFKFRNDTKHHVLISAEMNTATGEMLFYLWGTNDGRKGSYTPPKMLQYIPAGPAKTIETSDLAPGKKECQTAHPGAVATFNYIRTWPDGTKEVKEFKSNYRAVPATCYVGKETAAPEEPGATPDPTQPTPGTETSQGEVPTPVSDPAPAPVPVE